MNRLILLNKVREEKNNKLLTLSNIKKAQVHCDESYVVFKEKFDFLQDKEELNCLKNRNNKKIINGQGIKEIVRRIFLLNSNVILIKFINAIYNDALSINTKIKCIDNSETMTLKKYGYDIRIFAQDDYRKFEYKIQFQILDEQNMAVIISKFDFTDNGNNVININKKKREYEAAHNSKEYYSKCLIMLNSNIQVPDVYEVKSDYNGNNSENKVNVIKGWKYDFKKLMEENMYLLFPLKVLDLKKRLLEINTEFVSKDFIKDEILRFFNDMNRYLKKIKAADSITDKDINELNLIAIDLLNYFVKEKKGIFPDIKDTLKDIVV